MSDDAAIRALAARFFDAIEAGDVPTVQDIYDPAVVIWHGHTREAQDRDTNVETLAQFIAISRDRRYLDRKLRVVPGGFVQQHLLVATGKGGAVLELPAALICEVADGRITRLDEYFDNAAVVAWFAAPNFA